MDGRRAAPSMTMAMDGGILCRTRLGAGPQFVLALKIQIKHEPLMATDWEAGPLKKPHQFAAAANILRRDIRHQKTTTEKS